MANDRIYIKCKGCGKTACIAKYFMSPISPTGLADEFIANHDECHPNMYSYDLEGDPGFMLFTESDDNWESLLGD